MAVLVALLSWGSVARGFAQEATGRPFITKWQGKAGEELRIPIVGTNYKLVIKNEKGEVVKTEEKVTVEGTDDSYCHAFTPTADGVYTVEAGPEGVKYMKMRIKWEEQTLLTSNDKLLEVVQFGTVTWESMLLMFHKCKNMTFAASIDIPDLTKVTDMSWMFTDCTSFNQPLEKWDVSKVTTMFRMFEDCHSFNQPLNNWNVSQVTDMTYMFSHCESFNQPLNDWDVSKVTDMCGMFQYCSAFNQPLNNWDVSKVTEMHYMFEDCLTFNQPLNNWDVSKVTKMPYMFADCLTFNQPLNNWDVSQVTNMNAMFWGCNAFNQPLGSWKIRTAVEGLLSTAMSPLNYSATLVGWAAQSEITENVNFDSYYGSVYGLIYNNEGKTAREKLIAKGWKFSDDIYQGSGVAITPRALRLALNEEITLSLEKWGVEEGEKITLSSSEAGILSYTPTADGKGVRLQGLKVGECELTATIAAKEGVHEAYTSTCKVRVYIPVERITITPASKTLSVNEEVTLVANIFPTNATEKRVTWGSADAEIAINDAGKVTAKKVGTYTITARTIEMGSSVKGTCTITVVANNNGGNNSGGNNGGGNNGGGNNGGTWQPQTPQAVEDAVLASLSVMPNPFSSQLRIDNPEGITARYELVNASGLVVRFGSFSATEVLVDTETLPAGVYFVRLEAQNGAKKVVKVIRH